MLRGAKDEVTLAESWERATCLKQVMGEILRSTSHSLSKVVSGGYSSPCYHSREHEHLHGAVQICSKTSCFDESLNDKLE